MNWLIREDFPTPADPSMTTLYAVGPGLLVLDSLEEAKDAVALVLAEPGWELTPPATAAAPPAVTCSVLHTVIKQTTHSYLIVHKLAVGRLNGEGKINVVPSTYYATHYKDVWGCGGIAPLFLDHGTRWSECHLHALSSLPPGKATE
jgi:hypothetical protein